MAARPNVFTIPASVPFVPTLIRALVGGKLVPGFPASRDPLALAGATLYLPTRRACRLARDLFLDATGASAGILPRIVAIGDVDEDEIVFAQAAGTTSATGLDLPPALGGLERRMLLAQLVLKWAASITPGKDEAPLVARNPASAFVLADNLARLMDDVTTRGVSWERLDELVPEALDRYWQLTLQFLKIAREAWPEILAERGAIEPAARRDALIKAEAARLAAHPDGPVIAAGSTGSMPATAELIATIAKLSHGAVVLPGLDLELDAESWSLIGGRHDAGGGGPVPPAVGHPQFAMQVLLHRIGIAREEVVALAAPAANGRERYISEALRPAAVTDHWQQLGDCRARAQIERALDALAVIEAANAEEEAVAVAIALREAAETSNKTAALVTPDRGLARRVIAALERWKLTADDSGGDALADTPAGVFARLVAETALGGLAPVSSLALLKHPLMRLGAAEGGHARAVAALEKAALRGPRPRPGSTGLAHALAAFRVELAKLRRKEPSDLHPSDPRADLAERELEQAAGLIARLTGALAPLEGLRSASFAEIAARHYEAIAALGTDHAGTCTGLIGIDGTALDAVFEEIDRRRNDADFVVEGGDYADLFCAAIADRVVRRPGAPGMRLRIYGPLEARLQSVDRVVLGGLIEGIWPPETRSDPWLSRPMRHALGLDLPERRISLSAHDFAQALGTAEVILAYPAKLAGTPTVTSRFVQRLAAVAGEELWDRARANGAKYLAWARALDRPADVRRAPRPAPKPPLAARPTALSVTDVENWLRDPYTIYARHILRLRELDAVDLAPGAADRGIVIHGALSEFTKTFAAALPADPAGALIDIGAKHFAALEDYPEARAFWWPRFIRIARWFAGWENARRGNVTELAAETFGGIDIPLEKRVFTLRARADRIERLAGGDYAILDYKTGQVPTEKQVRIGISPQLTLEAAILRGGGFPGIPAGAAVAELVYVSLKGREPAGEDKAIDFKDGDADSQAERALGKLKAVIERFEDERQPYLPLVLPMWKSRYGAYDHLARVKEWAIGGAEDAETGE